MESRLYDGKRKSLKINDQIEFSCGEEKLKEKIKDLHIHQSFYNLFEAHSVKDFGGDSKDNLLQDIYNFYSTEEEEKYGVVGIKISLIF